MPAKPARNRRDNPSGYSGDGERAPLHCDASQLCTNAVKTSDRRGRLCGPHGRARKA